MILIILLYIFIRIRFIIFKSKKFIDKITNKLQKKNKNDKKINYISKKNKKSKTFYYKKQFIL